METKKWKSEKQILNELKEENSQLKKQTTSQQQTIERIREALEDAISRIECSSHNNNEEFVKEAEQLLNTKEQSTENKCEKCGGRLALMMGHFQYDPDSEPYESGKEEDSKADGGTTYLGAYKCDECKHLQGFWEE